MHRVIRGFNSDKIKFEKATSSISHITIDPVAKTSTLTGLYFFIVKHGKSSNSSRDSINSESLCKLRHCPKWDSTVMLCSTSDSWISFWAVS